MENIPELLGFYVSILIIVHLFQWHCFQKYNDKTTDRNATKLTFGENGR